MILFLDPQLQGTALLHVSDLVGSSERRIKTRFELEPLSVISNLSSDIDQENIILSAIFPHVHFPGRLGTLSTAGPSIVLRIGGVVVAAPPT